MPRRRPRPDAEAALPGWSPRDMLVPYLLLAISLQRTHGYMLEEYLRGLGFVGLEVSTLYRTLRQMEKDGLLHSAWEPGPTGPARRVYTLTEMGQTWLNTWAATLEAYRGLIDHFFALYTGQPPRQGPAPDHPPSGE
jgi:poly-beta-hydroxybutyrate-responsive repressor